jgi:hypothetical protein
MRRVLEQTEYFTEEAMKDRNPSLYQQYIGRHLSEAEANARTEHYGKRSLAEHLMDRLIRHDDDPQNASSDHSGDDSDDASQDEEESGKDKRPAQQVRGKNREGPAAHGKPRRTFPRDLGEEDDDDEDDDDDNDDEDVRYASELSRARRMLAESRESESAPQSTEDPEDVAKSSGDIHDASKLSEEEKNELRDDFERLMRERFLRGDDYDFDYGCCDHNLDLDLVSRSHERDAEEAYFDDDDGYLD